MKHFVLGFALALALVLPAVAIGQDQLVKLIFSSDGSKFTVKDTISSVGSVTLELNGAQYLMNVPIQIEIDATIPLTSSLVTAENVRRVGQLAITIVKSEESSEDIDVLMPNPYSGNEEEKEFEPSDGKKIVAVHFEVTNVGKESESIYSPNIKGIDDAGRTIESVESACGKMNPGETTNCVIVFDIDADTNISALDVEVSDHQELAVPKPE